MTQKSATYSRVKGGLLRRKSIKYTEEEKDTICSYFPPKNKTKALKETSRHVSELLSLLTSPLIPLNIKRKGDVEELEEIQKLISTLYPILKSHCQTPHRSTTQALKSALYKNGKMHLSKFTNLIKYSKFACEDAIKGYEIVGWKDQHYHTAIEKLANVWIQYSNKPLTRHSVQYEVAPELHSQKDTGPFIEYLKASILPPLHRFHINTFPSIPSIARDVMVRISQKFV